MRKATIVIALVVTTAALYAVDLSRYVCRVNDNFWAVRIDSTGDTLWTAEHYEYCWNFGCFAFEKPCSTYVYVPPKNRRQKSMQLQDVRSTYTCVSSTSHSFSFDPNVVFLSIDADGTLRQNGYFEVCPWHFGGDGRTSKFLPLIGVARRTWIIPDNLFGVCQNTEETCVLMANGGVGSREVFLFEVSKEMNVQWYLRWARRYDDQQGSCFARTHDGGFLVVGEYRGDPSESEVDNQDDSLANDYRNIFLMKTDSAGIMEWERECIRETWREKGRWVVGTSDGGFVITGYAVRDSSSADLLILKTDSLGQVSWRRLYGGEEEDKGLFLQQTEDKGYLVGGQTASYGSGSDDFWLLKVDSSGNKQWEKTYGGQGRDLFGTFCKSPDGGYVLVGATESFGAGGMDMWLVRVDSSGSKLWDRTYGDSGDDGGYYITPTFDGGYIVTGSTERDTTSTN